METPIWWPVLSLLYFGFASVYSGIISAGIVASSSYNREQDKPKTWDKTIFLLLAFERNVLPTYFCRTKRYSRLTILKE